MDSRENTTAKVLFETRGRVAVVTINRPDVRNAVDSETAAALVHCFEKFDRDPALTIAILTGTGPTFCAGADLKEFAAGRGNQLQPDGPGPMGPTRMLLSKPVIAAIEGYAVAGGLELAIWCDLRVAATNATFGVFCRRWGVPLIDLGTVRLPRLIGHSRAMDLILTGRGISGHEAERIGLVNRVVAPGHVLSAALALASELDALPQTCLRSDRLSAYEQWSLPLDEAVQNEFRRGMQVLASGESIEGARKFTSSR